MAPERYHSNVLEPLTPPRTPCARLRTRHPAPRRLTGSVVCEATVGPSVPTLILSRFRDECPRLRTAVCPQAGIPLWPNGGDAVPTAREGSSATPGPRGAASGAPCGPALLASRGAGA
ncbi:uncharacterized protein ACOB7L_011748 isoform 1-T2 [Callospermophilus lateralis]